jgi:transposase
MPAPLTIEVREAIVRARDSGLMRSQICELLDVCLSTVTRVLRRRRVLGTVAPLAHAGGNFSPIQGEFADLLHDLVARMPDATVAELTEVLVAEGGVQTSRSAVVRALRRFGYTRKKRPSQRASATRPSSRSVAGGSARCSL